MARSELEMIEWLTERLRSASPQTKLGIGDDMAIIETSSGEVLTTTDLLADGVHFDTGTDRLADIGYKCVACSLSDCAAMAVRPLAATVSVALPRTMTDREYEQLFEGLTRAADAHGCPIVGGDTVVWDQPLVVDVCITAEPWPGIDPVRRSGARCGDGLFVTGRLGGSRLGRHLTFAPRVDEARAIAEACGPDLHALMDLSDGLSLDLHRLCRASGVGAILEETLLEAVVHDDARRSARGDQRTPLEHALNDGEDFELLAAIDDTAGQRKGASEPVLHPIGVITEGEVLVRRRPGELDPLLPRGYQHQR
ncbi:MAG: thiamine-monophosphate kinase [bacterium]|nr:thiamine-monophosphate kinase [bacterium]